MALLNEFTEAEWVQIGLEYETSIVYWQEWNSSPPPAGWWGIRTSWCSPNDPAHPLPDPYMDWREVWKAAREKVWGERPYPGEIMPYEVWQKAEALKRRQVAKYGEVALSW